DDRLVAREQLLHQPVFPRGCTGDEQHADLFAAQDLDDRGAELVVFFAACAFLGRDADGIDETAGLARRVRELGPRPLAGLIRDLDSLHHRAAANRGIVVADALLDQFRTDLRDVDPLDRDGRIPPKRLALPTPRPD